MFDQSFSLSLALRHLIEHAGFEADVDDIHAALGLSLVPCVVPAEYDHSSWSVHARDAYLIPTAAKFGLTIRGLHPPEASKGIANSPEFAQHFDASYRPLIARALEHEQPVLAWRGWPGERRFYWGIIKEGCADGVGFCGFTFPQPDEIVPATPDIMENLPVQLYVVESCKKADVSADEVFAMALQHSRLALTGDLAKRFGILGGIEAIRAWADRVRVKTGGFVAPDFAIGYCSFASAVVNGHQSAIRFFQRLEPSLDRRCAQAAKTLISISREMVNTLARSKDLATVRSDMMEEKGMKRIIQDLGTIERVMMNVLATIESWARDTE